MDWLTDVLRWIFFQLDKLVYSLISMIYTLLVEIAEHKVFDDNIFTTVSSKVYALVGIFMLFKISFNVITYIINPDDFLDKNKGFGKIITTILISLSLLVVTPWIFKQAMSVQTIILEDNILGRIFAEEGTQIELKQDENNPNSPGQIMAKTTFRAFFTGSDGSEETGGTILDFMNSVEVNKKDSNDEYIYKYLYLISTVAGVCIILLLIVFCFDIAVRNIKIAFLQMLAPIPIISRVDPKGQGMFDKWLKACINTYLDLFMRLLAINFAVFIIAAVANNWEWAGNGDSKIAQVFIIFGALLFAKQLPQLIQDLTGVKLDGKFTMNPLKKLGDVPVAGKLTNTLAGGIDSAYHGNGFRAGLKRNWQNIPWAGDIKKDPFETVDRKYRKEINEKKDFARQRYEALDSRNKLNEQNELGKQYKQQLDAGKKVFSDGFAESRAKVDAAKAMMYQWQNYTDKVNSDYQAAVIKYGADAKETQDAYKKLEDANKNLGTAKGQYDYVKQQHDVLRKINIEDAKKEDAIEAFEKYGGGKPISDPPKFGDSVSGADAAESSARREETPKHGPNGKGDPVPGQPNPNTSKKKQERRKNNS